MKLLKKMIRTIGVIYLLVSSGAWAATNSFDDATSAGVAWLASHQSPLGGWEVQQDPNGLFIEALTEAGSRDSTPTTQLHDHIMRIQCVNGAWPVMESFTMPGMLIYGDSPNTSRMALAIKMLKSRQAINGSWPESSTNGADSTFATAEALRTLVLAGEGASPEALKAITFLKFVRNADGGWGTWAGSPSHICPTAPVVRALALALGGSDPYLATSFSYMYRNHTIPGAWSKPHELDALAQAPDLSHAQVSANDIINAQHADGSWDLIAGQPGDLGFTAQHLAVLCRAKRKGVSVPSETIDRAVAWLNSHVDADGVIRPTGEYSRIDLSAYAALALVAAHYPDAETIQRVKARFVGHTETGWHNYFALNYSYGTYCSGLAAAALAALDSNLSATLATGTVDRLLAEQNADGGWGFLAGGTTVSEASYTAIALFGLKRAHRASDPKFDRGVAWMQGRFTLGMLSNESKGWLLYALAGISRFETFREALAADLLAAQSADGGWSKNSEKQSNIEATAAALIGLNAAGAPQDVILRAKTWFAVNQNEDGGWGEYAGSLASDVTPTALASWALTLSPREIIISIDLSTERRIYLGGETVAINAVSSVADLDSFIGYVTNPDGTSVSVTFTNQGAGRYSAQYTVPSDQWPGRFIVTSTAVKGTDTGASACTFDTGLNRPINISPANGASIPSTMPTLVATAFEPEFGTAHRASRWQIREQSSAADWTQLVYDSGESQAQSTLAVASGVLRPQVAYAWRVCYKNQAGDWTLWSVPTTFSPLDGVSSGINWLASHQTPMGGWEPQAYLEGWYLEALSLAGYRNSAEAAQVHAHLKEMQFVNGSWPYLANALPGLLTYGDSPSDENIALAIKALKDSQASDGSWSDPNTNEPESVPMTSSYLRALIMAGEESSPEAQKAIAWFKSIRNSDGGWPDYAGGGSSPDFTATAMQALTMGNGKNDPDVKFSYEYMKAHPCVAGSWAKFREMEAIVNMGDAARAQSTANQIVGYQFSNGAWEFVSYGSGDLGTTALMVSALCRARAAGTFVQSTAIDKAFAFMNTQVRADGSITGNGTHARIDLSAMAWMALASLGQAGTEAEARVCSRFLAHTSGLWHNYFLLNGFGSYNSGLAAAALATAGNPLCTSLANLTADNIVAGQSADGGWGVLSKTVPSTISDTVTALYGLAKTGRQSSAAFDSGVTWVQTAYQRGQVNDYYKGWMLCALKNSTKYGAFRQSIAADLIAAQNKDGGWSRNPEKQSNCQATAAALIGLTSSNAPQGVLQRAKLWLRVNQNPDGGWGDYAGAKGSDVVPTALAAWALSLNPSQAAISVDLNTNRLTYYGGETVTINAVASAADLDSFTGYITNPDGSNLSLAFTNEGGGHYTARFTIAADQWPGRFMVTATAVKGTDVAAGACVFDAGLNRPMNISPPDKAVIASIAPTLCASAFNASYGTTHYASRWQVREASGPSDWSELAWDSGETNASTSITLQVGKLRPDVTYAWRVAYKDSNGIWTSWSIPTTFTALEGVKAGINWLVEHQSLLGGWEITTHNEPLTLDALYRAGQSGSIEYQKILGRIYQHQYTDGYFPLPERTLFAMVDSGITMDNPRFALGIEMLKAHLESDGSLAHMVDQTAWATCALARAGGGLGSLRLCNVNEIAAAVGWLKSVQNADGGFGDRPGGLSSSSYTTLAILALCDAVGPDDPDTRQAYNYYIAHQVAGDNWAAPHALEALVAMGDHARAANMASMIKAQQLGDGSWIMVGVSGNIIQTANNIVALCRAREFGVDGLDTAISKGVNYLKTHTQANGSVIDNGDNSRVYLSAYAVRALISASPEQTDAINLCRARFATHPGTGWSWYFQTNFHSAFNSDLACMALSRLGDSASLAAAHNTAVAMLAMQNADGGWGQFNGSPSSVDGTAEVLYGLAETGFRDDPKFASGVNWLSNQLQSGNQFFNAYKGWTLVALGTSEAFAQLRTSLTQSLTATQNADGGWGEESGRPSRVDTTAWALLGLNAAGCTGQATDLARQWLLQQQKMDGSWGEYPGGLAGMVDMTGIAVWALSEVHPVSEFQITVLTDRRSYLGGETVHVSVVTSVDVDSIEGTVTDPAGVKTDLSLSKIDDAHFAADFPIPDAQRPGMFVITVDAFKGAEYGVGARSFDVGLFRPINISPYDEATTISIAPTLKATDFDDSHTTSTHTASQWQVRDISSAPDYSQVVFDSGVDTTHKTSITLPMGRLLYGATYAWMVRYKDSHGRWSAWSFETRFTTTPASQFGERLVFDMGGDIWIMRTDGTEPTALTAGPARDSCPRISPDGQWIAYSSDQGGQYQIWIMHPDGSGSRAVSNYQSGNPIVFDWDPSSDKFAASGMGDTISVVWLNGSPMKQLLYLPFTQVRHIAWSSQDEIAIELSPFGSPAYSVTCQMNARGEGLTTLASDARNPAWTADGSLLSLSINGVIGTVPSYGTAFTKLIQTDEQLTLPAWSIDGSSLFFRSNPPLNAGVSTIYSAAADGTGAVSLKYFNHAMGSMDAGVIALGSNMPPSQPAPVAPADSAMNVPLVPPLAASAFSDPNPGDLHATSNWQVRLANESYETAVVDDVTTTELTSFMVEPGRLVPGQNYHWRVRYADNHGNTSPWSAERAFSTVSPPPSVPDKILIVAGGGDYVGNPIVAQTKFLAGYAWRLSVSRRVPTSQLCVLSAFPAIDPYGDGRNVVSSAASRQSLLAALDPRSGFAAGCDKLILYMIDHGSNSLGEYYYRINQTETISATELDAALDALQAARPNMKIAVVFDFCYSGGFVIGCAPQSEQYRICVSGSTQDSLAIFSDTIAGVSFSNFFFDSLASGANFKTAFDAARDSILAAYSGPPTYPLQVPWLEDDGDGRISSKLDGARAREFYWGSTSAYGISAPQIVSVTPDQKLNDSSTVKLYAEVAPGYTVQRVWASIVSPSTSYRFDQPITSMREVELVREGTSQIWSATVSDFERLGMYHVTFYASGYESTAVAKSGLSLQAGAPDVMLSMPRPTVIQIGTTRNAITTPWTLYR